MVLETEPCAHSWERRGDDTVWQCDRCGLQQTACPHPTWRRSAVGTGYVCSWCGAEPEEAHDEPGDADDL
jgi:hypothetical protein